MYLLSSSGPEEMILFLPFASVVSNDQCRCQEKSAGTIASSLFGYRGEHEISCLRSLSQLLDISHHCKGSFSFSHQTHMVFASFSHSQDDLLPLSLEIRLAPTWVPSYKSSVVFLTRFSDPSSSNDRLEISWVPEAMKLRMSTTVLRGYFCMRTHQTHFIFDQFIYLYTRNWANKSTSTALARRVKTAFTIPSSPLAACYHGPCRCRSEDTVLCFPVLGVLKL